MLIKWDFASGYGCYLSFVLVLISIKLKFIIYIVFKYVVSSKAPAWLSKFAPSDALVMQEEAWNAYPRCKSGLF